METSFLGDMCHDAVPGFLGLFDLSIAPPLLYYSYIPIILASTLVGLYVFYKDKYSLKSRLLLAVILFFVMWVINILVQWVGVHNSVVMFSWQLTALFEVGMFLSTAYFAQVFVSDRDISFSRKLIMTIVAIGILIFIPTTFNVSMYDLENCEGTNGLLWNFIYAFETAVIVLLIYWGISAYRKENNEGKREQIALFTGGIVIFLSIFFLFNFYGELTKVYEFNLWGPIGMGAFLILLGYIIVRYQTFNVKLFSTQALVVGITVLIGARLFYNTTGTGFVLSAATLLAFLISGYFLIQSVRREVEQREKIEKLAGELKIANEGQSNLIHIINHQIKGYLAKSRNIFSELLSDTDYGANNDKSKPMLEEGFNSLTEGVDFVTDFLHTTNIEKGEYVYNIIPLNFRKIVEESIAHLKSAAEEKGLKLELDITDGDYHTKGDIAQLEQVVRNLIDNSIKYTPSGNINVKLTRNGDKIMLAITDTGLGISNELKPRLFTKGGKDKDSLKINVNSTGFGLSFVKDVIEAHKGHVWADSAGYNQGSTFYLELPVV